MTMRRSMTALLLLLALAPVAITDDDVVQRTPPGASVVIDSRPEHAEIRLNGKFIGTTPLSYRLPAGQHEIQLVRPQFATWTRELTVSDAPTKVVALLSRDNTRPDCGKK